MFCLAERLLASQWIFSCYVVELNADVCIWNCVILQQTHL